MSRYHGGFVVRDDNLDGLAIGSLDVKVDEHGDIDLVVQVFASGGHAQLVLGLDALEAFELSGALEKAGLASQDRDEQTIRLGEELNRTVDTNG